MSDVKIHCAYDRMIPLDELRPNPKNPNTHPQRQIKLLAKIFRENGVRRPITVSNRSGLMTVGHGRLLAAKMVGLDSYPVDYQDYDSVEHEMADMLADNRIPELAEIDISVLEEDKSLLSVEGFDLEIAGFETFEGDEVASDNPQDEWDGMPEFKQDDKMSHRDIIVHFASEEDVQDFGDMVNQNITDKTKYIWHPKQKPANLKDEQYEDG